MKTAAATLYGPEDLRFVEHALPPLAPCMVRIKFGAGGICGSDLHYFRHARTGNFVVTEPLVLGHEIAGTIFETRGDVGGLQPGDRVAVNPSRWCRACARCREGRPNLCENIYFMGSASKTPHMQGGFAELFDVVPAQCAVLPQTVTLADAALAEPLAVALHAASRAGALDGAHVALFGGGPIGLLTMLAAKLAGAGAVTVVDIAEAPLAFARKLGADCTVDISCDESELETLAGGHAIDIAFEVSGTAAGLASAIRHVRRGGTLVQIGNLPGGEIPVPANSIMAKELDVRGAFRFGDEFTRAVELIASGTVPVNRLVTASSPLARAPEAFRLALDRSQSVKVVLRADRDEERAALL
jgi:L-idonate 5-dehydrogenase